MIAVNGRTILDMLLFRGNALRDWAKLVLAFGGVWWIAPWVLRRQDRFIRRTTAVVVPFVVVAAAVAVIDEVRQYGELVPVLLTPVLIALASRAGLASRPEPPSPGEAGGGI
jgi:hypothetical protein